MKPRICLLSFLISTSFNSNAVESFQPYIVNGSYASVTTFPSYAALFLDLIDYNNTYYVGSYCGATILDDTHILTAAHCVYSTNHNSDLYSLFTVVIPQLQYESYFPYSITEKQRVSKIYYPDNYNNSTLNNDLAILELESALTTVSSSDYAVRPSSGSSYRSAAESFYAVGHGNTESGVDNKDALQQAYLQYIDNSSCNYSIMTDTKLCMEGLITDGLEASTCQGDSGGPLYWYDSTQYVQVGLTSFGPATFCGDPSYSATSVFTEIYDYQTWIDNVLNGSETAKFIATEAKRQAYIDGVAIESAKSTSSDQGGGGPLHVVWVIILAAVYLLRRYMNK